MSSATLPSDWMTYFWKIPPKVYEPLPIQDARENNEGVYELVAAITPEMTPEKFDKIYARVSEDYGYQLVDADEEGTTALEMALVQGNMPLFKYICQLGFKQGRDLANVSKRGVPPPFWDLCFQQKKIMVQWLVQHGSNPDAYTSTGNTILGMAAWFHNEAFLIWLYHIGARNIRVKTDNGSSDFSSSMEREMNLCSKAQDKCTYIENVITERYRTAPWRVDLLASGLLRRINFENIPVELTAMIGMYLEISDLYPDK